MEGMRLFFASFLLLSPSLCFSGTQEPSLEEKIGGFIDGEFRVIDINNKDYSGVVSGKSFFLVSSDGRYVLTGKVIDLMAKRDLTEQVKNVLTSEKFLSVQNLNNSGTLVYSSKKPIESITLISDIDCPYCRQMHKLIPELNASGITVKVIMFPRNGFKGLGSKKISQIACSQHPLSALDSVMLGRDIGNNNSVRYENLQKCRADIEGNFKIIREAGISSTPATITSSGVFIPGYMRFEELITRIRLSHVKP